MYSLDDTIKMSTQSNVVPLDININDQLTSLQDISARCTKPSQQLNFYSPIVWKFMDMLTTSKLRKQDKDF